METISSLSVWLQAIFALIGMAAIFGGVFGMIVWAERAAHRNRSTPMRTANSSVIDLQARKLQRRAKETRS